MKETPRVESFSVTAHAKNRLTKERPLDSWHEGDRWC